MTKREAQKLFTQILDLYEQNMKDFGYDSDRINPTLGFNKKTSALGTCYYDEWEHDDYSKKKWHPTYCTIKLSEYAMEDGLSVASTLAHEVIHTFNDCQDHGTRFKTIARTFQTKTNIPVNTHGTVEECEKNGIIKAKREKAKYILCCDKCGEKFYYQRMCNAVKRPHDFRHNDCGGHLKALNHKI